VVEVSYLEKMFSIIEENDCQYVLAVIVMEFIVSHIKLPSASFD
jgi:hypothetical protein